MIQMFIMKDVLGQGLYWVKKEILLVKLKLFPENIRDEWIHLNLANGIMRGKGTHVKKAPQKGQNPVNL